MRIEKSSMIYRYATVFPFMHGASDGFALLLGFLTTTILAPILAVMATVAIVAVSFFVASCIAVFGAILSLFMDVPEPGSLTQTFLLHLKVGGAACAIAFALVAFGFSLAFIVHKLCKRIEILS